MKILLMLMIVFSILVSAALAEDLVIVGTGSGAHLLQALGTAFNEQNSEITILIPPSIGSGGGIKSVGQDENVLGRVAREFSVKEQRYGLKVLPIAKMPIVFIVNSSVSLDNISQEQVCRIYDGTTRKWEELAQSAGKIRVIRREDGDSSLAVLLKSLTGFSEITLTKRSKTTYSDPSTVNEVIGMKNSIAFGTWPNAMDTDGIRVLKLDGAHATDSNYPCAGTLSLIYKEENASGAMLEFFKFLLTPTASQIIIDAGCLPVELPNEN